MVKVKLELYEYGGIELHIGDFVAIGSYMTSLPYEWLESIRFSLQNRLPLCLELDEEGSNVWIFSNGDVIIIDDRGLDEDYHYTLVKDLDYRNFVWMLLKEIMKEDIFQRFVRWEFIPERFTEEVLQIRECELKSLIQDCKEALKELTKNDVRWRGVKLFD